MFRGVGKVKTPLPAFLDFSRFNNVQVTVAKEVGVGNAAEETTATQTLDSMPEGRGLSRRLIANLGLAGRFLCATPPARKGTNNCKWRKAAG